MKDPTMTAIRIVLTLNNLGNIPEHHQDSPTQRKKAATYFDDSLYDEELHKQIAHFGTPTVTRMVTSELSSWLSDLGAEPQVHSVTFDN